MIEIDPWIPLSEWTWIWTPVTADAALWFVLGLTLGFSALALAVAASGLWERRKHNHHHHHHHHREK